MTDKFVVLGVHGPESTGDGTSVMRVRMFVGDQVIDEDFPLPTMHPSIPKTEEIYISMLEGDITARMGELQ